MTDQSRPLNVIDLPEGCGNAPRRLLLRDFLVAFYSRQSHVIAEALSDDARWHIVGAETHDGVHDIQEQLESAALGVELEFNTIITHGTDASVDGSIMYVNGTSFGFSHIFRFTGHTKIAKIREIRSYLIETTPYNPNQFSQTG